MSYVQIIKVTSNISNSPTHTCMSKTMYINGNKCITKTSKIHI